MGPIPKFALPVHKIHTVLWFPDDAAAAAAADHYTSIFPSSRVACAASPVTNLVIAGQEISLLAGGPQFPLSPAVSLFVVCDDQDEIDALWRKLGPEEGGEGAKVLQCGWVTDRFGVSWQIVPRCLLEMFNDGDESKRARVHEAMLNSVKFDIDTFQRAYDGEEK